MRMKKVLACVQIALQFISPTSLCYLGSFSTSHAQENVIETSAADTGTTDQTIAQTAVQAGSVLNGGNGGALGDALVSTTTSAATAEVQNWLNQFGTARVSISTDEHFTLQDSELDLLLPLYDGKEHLWFTQLGGRRYDERNMVNAGLGYRYFSDSWMWGTNVFYDEQISANHHKRLGVGTEMGWDYLKLSANGYFRLSDWMASKEYSDYDERVANGFDIRANGYLPAWPQLGTTLVYEQYYGDSVGLFSDDEDDRQKNPHAITVGLNYTPVPMMTLGVNQKFGKGGKNDTQVNLGVSWTPGVPLSTQLDPDQVALRRSLLGSRMDLVDRNNNIVLEYRKQDLISLGLPPELTGAEGEKQTVTAKVKTKYGLEKIDWQGDEFFRQGGKITDTSSPEQVVLTFPAWKNGSANTYVLSAVARDKKGNASNTSQMKVNVSGMDVTSLVSTTSASPATLPADGISTSAVTVTLKTAAGENAGGFAERLSATLTAPASVAKGLASDSKAAAISAFKETSSGVYVATFTSGTTPGSVTVQPLIDGSTKLATAKIILEATEILPKLTQIDVSASSVPADGTTPITLTAHVVDQYGKPLPDAAIKWRADNPKALLSTDSTTTDAQGLATIDVTSREVISTIITAQLEQGNSVSTAALNFIADIASAQVVAVESEKQQVVANNIDTDTVTAQVKDQNNHPLAGITVNWMVKKSDGTPVSSKTSVSDNDGIAALELKSPKTGTVTVLAAVNRDAVQETDPIVFVADTSTQKVTTLTLSKTQALANGTDSITYEAQVTDAQGNAINAARVAWSADNPDATLSASDTSTGMNGKTTITVTSLKAGKVVVTAQTSEATPLQAEPATFIADSATATIKTLKSDRTSALANGSDAISLTATVEDANGNLLNNVDVNWTVDPATGTLSASSSKTDASGVARVTLSSRDVAQYSVTASSGSSSESLSGLNFIVDSSSAHLDTLTASSTQALADNKVAITLTAKVIDNSGHPVSGETINWTADNSKAQLSETQSVTNAQGETQIQVTSADVIATVITAQHDQAEALRSDTLNFVADPDSAKLVAVDTDKTQVVANNTDSATLTAKVTDANNHPLSGISVNWTVDKTDGTTLGNRTSQTDAQGVATTVLKSAKTGSVNVSAAINGGTALRTEDITFIADSSTQKVTAITLDKTEAIADGTDRITYEATVTDQQGNAVSGATVSWSADTSDAMLSSTQTISDSKGKSTITVTSLKAGEKVITAQTSPETAMQANSATFIADKTTAKVVAVSSDKTSALANDKDVMTLSATVTDAHANPLKEMNVSWKVTPDSGTLSETTSTSNTAGMAQVTLKSAVVASYEVTATVNGNSDSVSGLKFTADSATAQITTLTADKTADIVADKDVVTLTATVLDANQHPVAGETVNWRSSDEDNSTFTPASSVTDASGKAIVSFKTLKAGNVEVTASHTSGDKALTLAVIGNLATAQFADVVADKTEAVADGSTAITWKAIVEDKNHNRLPDVTVNWKADRSNVTLAPESAATDVNGEVTTSGTSLIAGKVVVTAALSSPAKERKANAVSFVGDVNTAKIISLTASKTIAIINTDRVAMTATVTDAHDNPVPDAEVNWQTTLNQLSATTNKTDASGEAKVTLAGLETGKAKVTATINGSSMNSEEITFVAKYDADWNITGDSDSYKTEGLFGFENLGFVAIGETQGPKKLVWAEDGNSKLMIEMTDEKGKKWNVTFQGQRHSNCSSHTFNSAVGCKGWESTGYAAMLFYARSDNKTLPAGVYHGLISFAGKQWEGTWGLDYEVTTTLTVN